MGQLAAREILMRAVSDTFMGLRAIAIASICVLAMGCTPPESTAKGQPSPSSAAANAAQAQAETAFRNATDGRIRTYTISLAEESPAAWRFFIEGTGDFDRPGYHWVVTIDKTTREASVHSGE
jgi:hypothetical protein